MVEIWVEEVKPKINSKFEIEYRDVSNSTTLSLQVYALPRFRLKEQNRKKSKRFPSLISVFSVTTFGAIQLVLLTVADLRLILVLTRNWQCPAE